MGIQKKASKPGNKVAEVGKKVRSTPKPAKEFFDITQLSARSVQAIETLINLGFQNGAVQLKDSNGNVVCVLGELCTDLKRELTLKIK